MGMNYYVFIDDDINWDRINFATKLKASAWSVPLSQAIKYRFTNRDNAFWFWMVWG